MQKIVRHYGEPGYDYEVTVVIKCKRQEKTLDSVSNISPRIPSVDRIRFTALLAHAEKEGIDTSALLRRYDIGERPHAQSNDTVALIDYFRVERDIARALDDLTAHLSTRKLTYRTGEFVLDQIRQSETLADAIRSLSEYFNMMHGGDYNRTSATSKTITMTTDDRDFPYAIDNHPDLILFTGECVQIKVHCLLDSLSNGLAARALRRVGIVRTAVDERSEHLGFWPRAPLPAQAVYTLSYDLGLARESIPEPNDLDLSSDGLLSRIIGHLEATTAAHRDQQILERVHALFALGETDQDRVAAALNLSVATLRRRLTESGANFRQLLDQYRLSEAEILLKRGFSVSEVAENLKYSDVRAFNRAFKRWKGVTPFAFKRQS